LGATTVGEGTNVVANKMKVAVAAALVAVLVAAVDSRAAVPSEPDEECLSAQECLVLDALACIARLVPATRIGDEDGDGDGGAVHLEAKQHESLVPEAVNVRAAQLARSCREWQEEFV
jgi:hypothetical protein